MTDEKLIELSNELDTVLVNIANKYELDPLMLTGVVMARLVLLSQLNDCREDFNNLLFTVMNSKIAPSDKITLQ
jgi:hypothetical protein